MLGIIIILLFSAYLAFLFPTIQKKSEEEPVSARYANQMKKLWTIAQDSMKDNKPLRAEKALLTILKFDEKNAAAYNRLGILYAKRQKFDDAIECFEIAQSLDSNASSLHNVGMIYLETKAYEKAAMAFRQAIELEGDVPSRYSLLAKAEEEMGNRKNAIEALETAYDLDHSISTLRKILAIHESAEDTEAVAATSARIEQQIAEDSKRKEAALKNKRRSMYNRNVRLVAKRPIRAVKTVVARRPIAKRRVVTKQSIARPTTSKIVRRPVSNINHRPTKKI